MKFLEKGQIILIKNIKIIIRILISIFLKFIFTDLDIANLEPELELDNKLNLELETTTKEEDNLILKEKENNIYYYVIGSILLIGGGLLLFYYYNNGNSDVDFQKQFQHILDNMGEVHLLEKKYLYDEDAGRYVMHFRPPLSATTPPEGFE